MPSPKRRKTKRSRKKGHASHRSGRRLSSRSSSRSSKHVLFYPLLFVVFILWLIYRTLSFPVWFDELIAKAIFFGIPVWIYILASGMKEISETFAAYKLKRGLMLGIAVGGVFGFAVALLGVWQKAGGEVYNAYLFMSDQFWWEFLLSLATGFWETVFFFSFVYLVIQEKLARRGLLLQIILTALIFLVFHLPNTVLRYGAIDLIVTQSVLLFFFAIGQSLLFTVEKNAYALVLSHAIWGMALLVHLGGIA